MGSPLNVCAFTSVCEEDAHWIPQYLAEAERLDLPFVVLLDRCSDATYWKFVRHPLCQSWTSRGEGDGEFTEQAKQPLIDRLRELGFRWGMAWDVDETYGGSTRFVLDTLDDVLRGADYGRTWWVNLWGDERHVRIDGPFGHGNDRGMRRVKFYRIGDVPWHFAHPITNGAKPRDGRGTVMGETEIVCLHHGMMTRDLRLLHKERWDRIYSKAVGSNPYGFWNYACDEETYPPTVVPHNHR